MRALFEGVAFEHKSHVETLLKAGADFDSVIVVRSRETGALGAAIAAGTGVGLFADYSAGAAAMAAAARHFAPNEAVAEAYARRYLLYSEINSAMVPLWERIAGQQART